MQVYALVKEYMEGSDIYGVFSSEQNATDYLNATRNKNMKTCYNLRKNGNYWYYQLESPKRRISTDFILKEFEMDQLSKGLLNVNRN